MPTELNPICKKIADAVKGLENAKKSLTNELKEAAPAQKPFINSQIKELNKKIAEKKKDLDDCNKKNPPVAFATIVNPCLDLKKELDKLKAKLNKQIHDAVAPLQKELQKASPSQKAAVLAEIRRTKNDIKKNSAVGKQVAAKQKEYNKCLTDNGGLVALNATFRGTATLKTSNADAKGPFTEEVTIGLHFSDWDRHDVTITSFPPISVTFETPIGENTTTVSLIQATGQYSPSAKKITLGCLLSFDHSIQVAGDSTVNIQLQTKSTLNSKGDITVEGTSTFEGGFLGGDTCWLTVKGNISPHP